MLNSIKLKLFPFILCIPFVSFAQYSLTIENCVTEALKGNLSIQNATIHKEAVSLNSWKANLNVLPSVNANYSHSLSSGSQAGISENENSTSGSFSINASLPVFRGLENYYYMKKSKLQLLAAEAGVFQLQNDISLRVASLFIEAVYYRDVIALAQEQIKLSNLQIDRTERFIAAGTQTKYELLKLEYQQAQEHVRLQEAENNLHQTLIKLTGVMNWQLSRADSIELSVPSVDRMTESDMPELNTIVANAFLYYPSLKVDSLQIATSELDEKIALSGALPSASIGYSLGKRYNTYPKDVPMSDQFFDYTQNSLSFNVNIPIFNRGDVLYQKKRAQIATKEATISLSDHMSSVEEEVRLAYDSYILAKQKLEMQTIARKAAMESFSIAEKKLNAGMSTILDYTIEKNNLLVTETNLINAKYEYIFAMKVLDLYQGKPISL